VLKTAENPNYNIEQPVFTLEKIVTKPLNQAFDTVQADNYKGIGFSHFDFGVYKDESIRRTYVRIMQLARGYVRNWEDMKKNGEGFYLWSKNAGSGKTLMACMIANELFKRYKVPSQVLTMSTIFKMIQDTFDNEDISELKLFNIIEHIPLLIIDEIGSENRTSDWKHDKVSEIIDMRYNARKPVIFTSNLHFEDFKYHDRVKSRIDEMSIMFEFPKFDYRRVISDRREELLLNKLVANKGANQ